MVAVLGPAGDRIYGDWRQRIVATLEHRPRVQALGLGSFCAVTPINALSEACTESLYQTHLPCSVAVKG